MSKDLIVRIAHNLVETIEENNNFNKIIYEKKHIFKIYVHIFIIKNIGDIFQMSYKFKNTIFSNSTRLLIFSYSNRGF
jgi:hypothetical protein